jgi:hypothetical protein
MSSVFHRAHSFLFGEVLSLWCANGLSEEYEYNALELLESVWYNKGVKGR